MHRIQKMQRSKNVLLAHWQLILFQNEGTAHSSIFIKEKKMWRQPLQLQSAIQS